MTILRVLSRSSVGCGGERGRPLPPERRGEDASDPRKRQSPGGMAGAWLQFGAEALAEEVLSVVETSAARAAAPSRSPCSREACV